MNNPKFIYDPTDFLKLMVGREYETRLTFSYILDILHIHDGELPDDEKYISGLLGCSIAKWRRVRRDLILADLIEDGDDYIIRLHEGAPEKHNNRPVEGY